MTVHTLIIRGRALRARAAKTDLQEFSHPAEHAIASAKERQESLKLLSEMEQFCDGTWAQYRWLSEQVYELLGTLTRDATGHPWKRDLPDRDGASDFYQKAVALARFMKANHPPR